MKSERSRFAAGLSRVVPVSALAILLASCTSAPDQQLTMKNPGFAADEAAAVAAVDAEAGAAASGAQAAASDYAEPSKPAAPADPEKSAAEDDAIAKASLAKTVEELGGPQALAASTPPSLVDGKKREFLSSFFSADANAPRQAGAPRPLISEAALKPMGSDKPKALIQLASAEPGSPMELQESNNLPGVRQTMLFEIRRKSGIDDDSDVDVNEGEYLGETRVASAAGMARLAPNGLLKQRETVDTACLKPSLVKMLKGAEAHFGKRLILTSGYRSPSYNRKVNGAKRSMHMFCAAADIQMPGVSKWELATYFRALPGRGGVGTYCSTESIHVDVGPERDWNWKCGRRRG